MEVKTEETPYSGPTYKSTTISKIITELRQSRPCGYLVAKQEQGRLELTGVVPAADTIDDLLCFERVRELARKLGENEQLYGIAVLVDKGVKEIPAYSFQQELKKLIAFGLPDYGIQIDPENSYRIIYGFEPAELE